MAIIKGTSGNDTLTGGSYIDKMYGYDGNDSLKGLGLGDYLNGGNGDDKLYGGDGDDFLEGGAGADILFGDAGNDTLWGWDGNDVIDSGGGRDKIDGGAGNDRIKLTGNVHKQVNGGTGDDTIDVYARGLKTATDFNSVLSGDDGYDTMKFSGQGMVNGETVKTTVLSQYTDGPGGYRMDYQTAKHTDHAADILFIESFDFRSLPGNVDVRLAPWAGEEVSVTLSAGMDKVGVDLRNGTGFSTIDLHAFAPGKDKLTLTGGDVVKADVAVSYDAGGALLTVEDGLEIYLTGVSRMTYGTDWTIA